MKFRTEYIATPAARLISPEQPVLFLGSCFASYIGSRLRASLWNVTVNPCGTLFNPVSIRNILFLATCKDNERRKIIGASVEETPRGYASLLLGSLSSEQPASSAEEGLQRALRSIRILENSIKKSAVLFVTLGTAFVYDIRSAAPPFDTAGNCRGLPAGRFNRRLLTPGETSAALQEIEELARRANPGTRVIFTVSPVRHLRDDFHGNALSKSTLLLATRGHEYFPAYEIVMDDLRDYRFYDSDLTHPSGEAVEYILEKFLDTYVSEKDRKILTEGENLTRRWNHRPLTPGTPSDSALRGKNIALTREFLMRHPTMLAPEGYPSDDM